MNINSLKNLTYRIPKGTIPWNKGRKGDVFGTRNDITGKRFGRLIAIKLSTRVPRKNGNFRYKWLFKCNCGNEVITDRSHVVNGHTTSCGCYLKELQDKVSLGKFKTHGLRKDRFYRTFRNILNRCNNPKNNRYNIYGGRCIRCLWNSFEEFRDDMYKSYLEHIKQFGAKNTSIDRIDVNGHYQKKNCRWATAKEQANNRRLNVI